MPTVSVDALALHERLREVLGLPDKFDLDKFTSALDELCFEFGLEYDGIDQSEAENARTKLKIEVGANRYDLLCLSGIADALVRFRKPAASLPRYRYSVAEPRVTLTVDSSVLPVRPYVVAAVYRGAKFDELSFQSFIDLQDKLHQNLGRKRTLVSIGTHDMAKLRGPFFYRALPKKGGFTFEPLKHAGTVVDGQGMFELLADSYLKPYLPIIEGFDVTPIICEEGNKVVSVPPIINADRCKMSVDTKDVFVEITATDSRKAQIFLDVVTCFMGEIVKDKFTVEPVKVIYTDGHPGVPVRQANDEETAPKYQAVHITPDLKERSFYCATDYIRRIIGVPDLDAEKMCTELLPKMGLSGTVQDGGIGIQVRCPISRRDILHPCDIVEDIAIAFGYDNILPRAHRAVSLQPIANIAERARRIISVAGWKECLAFGLVAVKDVYQDLRRERPKSLTDGTEWFCWDADVVTVAAPKAREFECVRSTLIPGVLKTLSSNQAAEMPIKLFEIGDCVAKCDRADNKAVQRRHVAALIADAHRSGLEDIHGLLDVLLRTLNLTAEYSMPSDGPKGWIYYLKEVENGPFLKGRTVSIEVYRAEEGPGSSRSIGLMGVIHPDVLQAFGIPVPCSLFEISLEPFRQILLSTDQTMP